MDEIINTDSEEVFEGPAVVEKISLDEIKHELEQEKLEQANLEKQQINKAFDDLANALKALSDEDIDFLDKAFDDALLEIQNNAKNGNDNKIN